MSIFDASVTILEEFLGSPKSSSYSGQYQFCCPHCDNGRYKYNLEVNLRDGFFSCHACWQDEGGVWGKNLFSLFYRFGNIRQFNIFKELMPLILDTPKTVTEFALPLEYAIVDEETPQYWDYLHKRGLTQEHISQFKIGYCDSGIYKNRIIVPSFDKLGNANYFVARRIDGQKNMKYLNPQFDKSQFFFNEYFINWFMPIVIVEGVFDHLVVPNSIPILGKYLSDWQASKIVLNAHNFVYIALDNDASKECLILKNKLNVGNLKGKVKIVTLRDKDFSEIYQKNGMGGVFDTIKKCAH